MERIIKNAHFVGIGGADMSGIAEMLLDLGYRVMGSDLGNSATTQHLATLGATIMQDHAPEYVIGTNAVVAFTVVRGGSPEVLVAHAKHIPVVPRTVILAELMCLKQGITVAGTHGKMTTTNPAASVLAEGGLDPTFVIEDHPSSADANACLDTGDFVVAEADESDTSFLNLFFMIEVITSVDANHMDTYGYDFARLERAFIEFTQRLPFYGTAMLYVDDPNVRETLPLVSKPVVRYGFVEDTQVRAVNARVVDDRMEFTMTRQLNGHAEPPPSIMFSLPGLYNVQNALVAIAIATEPGVPGEAIVEALTEFSGVGRRSQCYDEVPTADDEGRFTLIDDYDHHPVEMATTLAAARGVFPDRYLVLSFQPHRFTRTRDCFEDFIKVFGAIDALSLAEAYAASEPPIVAANGRALTRAPRVVNKIEPVFMEQTEDMPQVIIDATQSGDVTITVDVGSIGQVPGQVVALQAQVRTVSVVDLSGGAAA